MHGQNKSTPSSSSVPGRNGNEAYFTIDSGYVKAALIISHIIIIFICFVGNLAVFLVTTFHGRKQRLWTTKFCLLNLAIADLTVGLFCVCSDLVTYVLETSYLGEWMCKASGFMSNLCNTASILILVVVALERYLVVVHTFRSRQLITVRRLGLTILSAWGLGAVLSSPNLLYHPRLLSVTVRGGGKEFKICVPHKSLENSATAGILYFLVLFLIPLGIITALYIRIALHLRKKDQLWNVWRGEWSRIVQQGGSTILVTNPKGGHGHRLPFREFHFYSTAIKVKGCEGVSAAPTKDAVNMPSRRGLARLTTVRKRSKYRSSYKRLKRSRAPSLCQQRIKAVQILLFIVVAFAVINLPFHVRKLCRIYEAEMGWSSDGNALALFALTLRHAGCAVNPILHAFMSRSFRGSLKDLLSGCRKRRQRTH